MKGSSGHTESAVGIVDLIKQHYVEILPYLHYLDSISSINTKRLNPSIPASREACKESQEFIRGARVNNFRFGGEPVFMLSLDG